MSDQLQKREPASLEYVPFGALDKIKLNLNIVKQFCCTPTKTGQVCSDRDAMRFMMLCSAQRLNPFTNDAYLVGYDGRNGAQFSLITAYTVFLKRAETCPEYDGMESGIVILSSDGQLIERETDFCLPDENVVGGWARVHRKDRKIATYRKLSIEAMRPPYDTPFWSKAKAPGQICKCAEADALRSTFPTLLGGLYTQGEILDMGQARVPTQFPALRQAQIPNAPSSEAVGEAAGQAQEGVEERGEPEVPPLPTNGPVAELAELITGQGFTFSHFQRWAIESGNLKDADTIPGFEAVSETDARRFLRAKTGLLKGLAMAKESESA